MQRIMISTRKCWGINSGILATFMAGIAMICCIAKGQEEESVSRIFKKHDAPVKALVFSSDGKTIATGGDDKMVYFWDIETGEITGSIENHFAVKSLCFSADHNLLAACGPDIKLMDRQGKLIRTFSGYTTDIWSFSYHEPTHRIAAGSYSKIIKVWDASSGKAVLSLEGHEKSCLPVCYSPDGTRIASGSLDKTVRLWDALSGKQLLQMELHSENIFAVDFHPSGKYLASASADKTIRLWNAETGKIVRTFIGHDGAVFDVRFSTDGNHMISCSADRTVILWETATGKRLHTFTGHTGMVNAVRFSPDNRFIGSVSDDQSMRLWPLEKKYFVEPDYGSEIEQAKEASALFGPRKNDETRQQFAEREKKAETFLKALYEEYFMKYTDMIRQLPMESVNQ
jgi:WD40 repeat protein